jgi:hypothetical protein
MPYARRLDKPFSGGKLLSHILFKDWVGLSQPDQTMEVGPGDT